MGLRSPAFDSAAPADGAKVIGRVWTFTQGDVLWRSLEGAVVSLVGSVWFGFLRHRGCWRPLLLLRPLLVVGGLRPGPWGRPRGVGRAAFARLLWWRAGA